MPRRDILADDLPAEVHEGLVDVAACPGRALVVGGVVPGAGDGEGARARHGPVFFQVALVADDDEGDERVVFDAYDLVAEFLEFG